MVSDTQADERRFSDRISWKCHARLLPLSLEPRTPVVGMHEATGSDISEGGLQICSDRLFALRSRLLVEMDSPELPEGIQAVGAVAWISATSSGDNWYLGIEFSDVGELALSSIRNLIIHERYPPNLSDSLGRVDLDRKSPSLHGTRA